MRDAICPSPLTRCSCGSGSPLVGGRLRTARRDPTDDVDLTRQRRAANADQGGGRLGRRRGTASGSSPHSRLRRPLDVLPPRQQCPGASRRRVGRLRLRRRGARSSRHQAEPKIRVHVRAVCGAPQPVEARPLVQRLDSLGRSGWAQKRRRPDLPVRADPRPAGHRRAGTGDPARPRAGGPGEGREAGHLPRACGSRDHADSPRQPPCTDRRRHCRESSRERRDQENENHHYSDLAALRASHARGPNQCPDNSGNGRRKATARNRCSERGNDRGGRDRYCTVGWSDGDGDAGGSVTVS